MNASKSVSGVALSAAVLLTLAALLLLHFEEPEPLHRRAGTPKRTPDTRTPARKPAGNGPEAFSEEVFRLAEKLKDENQLVRRQAADSFKKIQEHSAQAVPYLIEQILLNKLPPGEAVAAIINMGRHAVPYLVKMLDSENDDMRLLALQCLGRIGPDAKQAIPSILAKMKKAGIGQRISLAELLVQIGAGFREAVPFMSAIFADSSNDPVTRQRAAYVLGSMGSQAGEAVACLVEGLKSPDYFIRADAAVALGNVGIDAHNAVAELIQALQDESCVVRCYAAEALGKFGPKADRAVPGLTDALKNEDNNFAFDAAKALGNIGEPASSAVHALVKMFLDLPTERSGVAEAVGKIDAGSLVEMLRTTDNAGRGILSEVIPRFGSDVIPHLIATLKDDDHRVRSCSASILGSIGKDSREALWPLVDALKDDCPEVRFEAAHALGSLGEVGVDAIPGLATLVRDTGSGRPGNGLKYGSDVYTHEDSRRAAAQALGKTGKEALPCLLGMLEDKDEYVRAFAVEALGDMGETAVPAVPSLIAALQDEEYRVRANSVYAISKMGEHARDAVPELAKLVGDEEEFTLTRWQAAEILGNLGRHAEEAVPQLVGALQDKDYDLRRRAARALGEIGSENAVPALTGALDDEDKYVRGNARDALQKIREAR